MGPCFRRDDGGVSGNRVVLSWASARLPVMKATATKLNLPAAYVAARVDAIDWAQATADLDAQGCAVLKSLLTLDECRAIAALYPDEANFRSRVVMGRHGFGRGEYQYFSYPLPPLIQQLRPALYAKLQN